MILEVSLLDSKFSIYVAPPSAKISLCGITIYPFMQAPSLSVGLLFRQALSWILSTLLSKWICFSILPVLPLSYVTFHHFFHVNNYNDFLFDIITSNFFSLLPMFHNATKMHIESCCIPFLYIHICFLFPIFI